MTINISIRRDTLTILRKRLLEVDAEQLIMWVAIILAVSATTLAFFKGWIIAYGDAESHLNIAKRVVHSITPGLAQLGGIWLPLPHILLIPFVYFDSLWRTGLAGSIVSGAAFVISAIYMFKLTKLLTRSAGAALLASVVFMINPNILYLQTTPMTEIPLIAFFILSTYYFVSFIRDQENIVNLILAAIYGFAATLSRYDGWFLVLIQAGILFVIFFPFNQYFKSLSQFGQFFSAFSQMISKNAGQVGFNLRKRWHKMEGTLILFCTVAFFGILLWLGWDALILGDPLFFTHSEFSAKSQQQGWLAVGQLPAYKNLWLSFLYYFVTAMSNVGVFTFITAIAGLIMYLLKSKNIYRWLITLLLMTPFIFYVITLYIGQSIVYVPHLTPKSFDWQIFNVRYGVVMVPAAAIFIGYLFSRLKLAGKFIVLFLLILNIGLFTVGYSKVISLEDGLVGLSHAEQLDAELWLKENYDDGLVLLDDFSRLTSIVRSGMPMQNMIYVGNKPYWEDSLIEPDKYASWIVLQKNDILWKQIWEPEHMQKRVYAHFTKVYTSPEILIFKRTKDIAAANELMLDKKI